ncbi:Uncharacterised protein [Shewanella putrefaciens]|nr:Uncharacterised protein [Shewanella putrefaciens]
MNLLIISTSQRANSQSAKVAKYIAETSFLSPIVSVTTLFIT